LLGHSAGVGLARELPDLPPVETKIEPPGLTTRRGGSGLARGSHSCHGGLEAVSCWPLELDGHTGKRERAGLDWALATGLRAGSTPRRDRWGDAFPGWQLT